jgi:very-short-patch-repair endonuclease
MPVVIIPQFKVLNYRLDLAIAVRGKYRGILFAIELDGADFHDAVADSERDKNLKTIGITTLRVSGSSIYRDPAAAADWVIGHLWFWLTQE